MMVKKNRTKCNSCRSVGQKLYLKGKKCYTTKCPIAIKTDKFGNNSIASLMPGFYKRNFAQYSKKLSLYGKQIIEKRKLKRIWNIKNNQIKKYKRNNFIDMNYRLDYVLFLRNYVYSFKTIKQLIKHNFFLVNGKLCNIRSRILKIGDIISIKDNKKKKFDIIFKKQVSNLKSNSDLFFEIKDKYVFKIKNKINYNSFNKLYNLQYIKEFYKK